MLKFILLVLLFLISLGIIYFVFIKAKEFVRVSGNGKAEIKPDQAQVDIGLRSADVSQQQLDGARQQSAAQFQRIVESIKKNAPQAKLETQAFNVSENYNSDENAPKTFTISNRISVTIKDANGINLLPAVIDGAIANGANDVGNVSYTLTDDAKKIALSQAQADSMRDAYEKAKNLAQSGGRTVGGVQTIEESGQPEVFPVFARASFAADKAAGPQTPIVAPETVPITSNVTVQYALDC